MRPRILYLAAALILAGCNPQKATDPQCYMCEAGHLKAGEGYERVGAAYAKGCSREALGMNATQAFTNCPEMARAFAAAAEAYRLAYDLEVYEDILNLYEEAYYRAGESYEEAEFPYGGLLWREYAAGYQAGWEAGNVAAAYDAITGAEPKGLEELLRELALEVE